MAEMAIPLIIGGAASAGGKIMSGIEQSRAAAGEAQQYKIQQQQYQTAAAQDEAKRRTELTSAIDTIMAVRAQRGVGQGSGTETAILSDLAHRAEGDIYTAKTNLLSKSDQARIASDLSERKSRSVLLAADFGAVADLAKTGFEVGRYASITSDIAKVKNAAYFNPARIGTLY